MNTEHSQSGPCFKRILSIRSLYNFLAPCACSVIIFAALFCTLAVKLFHSLRMNQANEYFDWILADIAVLVGIEVVLSAVCFRWPQRWVIRTAVIFAAVVCTWSVMSAGWVIRTGTQILPPVLLPLVRAPLNSLSVVGVNLVKMPVAAVILLGPSAIALTFFFFVLARPLPPEHNRKRLINKIFISLIIIFIAVLARGITTRHSSAQIASAGLRYNCQLRAITGFLSGNYGHRAKVDLANATRKVPAFDQIRITPLLQTQRINHNIIIIVLEGVQYKYTSLGDKDDNLTPYLTVLAKQGAEFANTRSTLTHTTKVLFGLLTGRFPSASQDIAETIPVEKPYAGLTTILKRELNFRTAFFQSAKGNFESRPGLVHNLGFDKFWARDDLNDPNCYLGYLACDEFAMLKPITEWLEADEKPFLLTIMCSVTHDPYEVPDWFAAPAREPIDRYRQTISYTDKFIAALDGVLAELNLADKTIFCVIGDHGEAFGEHGLLGHERIVYEEALHIPWVMRAPFLVKPATKVTKATSSVDLAPTLLALLGFDIDAVSFDGVNALGIVPDDRKVYFSGWMQGGPAGFVKGNRKFIYNPTNKIVSVYDLSADPFESDRIELDEQQAQETADQIIAWRKDTIFRLNQQRTGKKMLFDSWLCRWTNRVASAKYTR